METTCAVCTETLVFCAFGPCHHQEVCSRCMARLRLLDKNMSCAICREDCPIIYVTRFMDDHTLRIAQDRWGALKEESLSTGGHGHMRFMKKISAVFDDAKHFSELLHASSLTHPMLEAKSDVTKLHIRSIQDLKRVISTQLSMSFCELCLKNRPVFTSEQVLYTKAGLAQHNAKGDDEGPLKEANFKGHPKCSFCKNYFYDQTEQFQHMEKNHYHCHICRRENPDNYKYFKDYPHLEEHFEQEHHLCPFPDCRANKFVVFSTEAELHGHAMKLHKDDINMKRHERRSALQLETGFTTGRMMGGYGRGQGGYEEEPAFQNVMRPPTVIGGGGAGGAAAGAVDMRRRANEEEEESRRVAAHQRATPLDISAEEHFPGLSNGPLQAPMGAQWGRGGYASGSRAMQAAFPSLADSNPLSKGQKKKLKAKSKRDVGGIVRMGRPQDAPPAHLMVLGQEQALAAHVAEEPDAFEAPTDDFRAPEWTPMGRSVAERELPSSMAVPSGPPPGTTQGNLFSGLEEYEEYDIDMPPSGLGGSGAAGVASRATQNQQGGGQQFSRGQWQQRVSTGAGEGGGASFPALSSVAPAAQPLARQGWITLGKKKQPAPVAASAAKPSLNSAAAFPTLSGPSGEVRFNGSRAAEETQRATDALMAEIKAKLSPNQFRTFKNCSAELAAGSISAQSYHAAIVKLGLATSISHLMALCPSHIRRKQVLAVHEEYINSGAPETGEADRWEPPEAVRAAAQRSSGGREASRSTWNCAICTLANQDDLDKCNACGTPKVISSVHEAEESAAAAAHALGKANIMAGGKKKKSKKVTMSFQDVNRTPNSTTSHWGQR